MNSSHATHITAPRIRMHPHIHAALYTTHSTTFGACMCVHGIRGLPSMSIGTQRTCIPRLHIFFLRALLPLLPRTLVLVLGHYLVLVSVHTLHARNLALPLLDPAASSSLFLPLAQQQLILTVSLAYEHTRQSVGNHSGAV